MVKAACSGVGRAPCQQGVPMCRHLPKGLAVAMLLAGPWGASGADVYRWVDDQGQTHFSDTVPEAYRDRARPLTLPGGPSAEERQRARARAEQARARADAGAPAAAEAAGEAPPPPEPAPQKRPARAPDPDADCETWQSLYQESLDCFGPYRNVRGGLRAEAFEHCTEVREPPPRCIRRLR